MFVGRKKNRPGKIKALTYFGTLALHVALPTNGESRIRFL
jgi:hypothetical protein